MAMGLAPHLRFSSVQLKAVGETSVLLTRCQLWLDDQNLVCERADGNEITQCNSTFHDFCGKRLARVG